MATTYEYISELPPQVREVLSINRQEQWLEAWKRGINTGLDESTAYNQAWQSVLANAYEGEIADAAMPDFSPGPKVAITIHAATPEEAALYDSTEKFSFVLPVEGLLFEDNGQYKESWLQALPLGKYQHPRYGEIEITPDRVARFVANVKNQVRGQMLDIDYEHKENPAEGGRAAGWVVDADDRGAQGMYVKVRWTPRGQQSVLDKEYQYFSPEFSDKWQHPKTQIVHEDVMFGGALTNRPFLKDLLPINLSEHFAQDKGEEEKPPEGREELPLLDDIKKALNLPDDVKDEQLLDAIKTDYSIVSNVKTALSLQEPAQVETKVKELHEFYVEKNKVDEKAKKFEEDYPEQAAELKKLAEQTKKTEVTAKLAEWTEDKEAKRGIPVKLHEKIEPYRLALDGEAANQFDEIMSTIVKTGLVDFSEKGYLDETDKFSDDAEKFLSLVEKHKEEQKVSFSDAVRAISAQEPELAKAYLDNAQSVAGGGE